MEEQIKEIIEKNLPKQLGETLQTRFKELEKTEKEYKALFQQHEKTVIQNSELTRTIEQLKSDLSHFKNIAKREKELIENEYKNSINNQMNSLRVEEADKRALFAQELLFGLTKNTTLRKSILTQDSHMGSGHYDNNNNWIIDKQISEETTEE